MADVRRKARPIGPKIVVAVERKGTTHPRSSIGASGAFVFYVVEANGRKRKLWSSDPLVLQVGCVYTFEFDPSVESHPLFFTAREYVMVANRTMSRNRSLLKGQKMPDRGQAVITMATDVSTRQLELKKHTTGGRTVYYIDDLYYQCWNHPAMGYQLRIEGSKQDWEKAGRSV